MSRIVNAIVALVVAVVKAPFRPLCKRGRHPFRKEITASTDKCLVCGLFVSGKETR